MAMTNWALTIFRGRNAFFHAFVAGGIVGVLMFAFTQIFEAPLTKEVAVNHVGESSAVIVQMVNLAPVLSVDSSVDAHPEMAAVPIENTLQSWPPQTFVSRPIFASPVDLTEQLFTVGLSGVIPPPVFASIFSRLVHPVAFSSILKNIQGLKTKNNVIVFSTTGRGIV